LSNNPVRALEGNVQNISSTTTVFYLQLRIHRAIDSIRAK